MVLAYTWCSGREAAASLVRQCVGYSNVCGPDSVSGKFASVWGAVIAADHVW